MNPLKNNHNWGKPYKLGDLKRADEYFESIMSGLVLQSVPINTHRKSRNDNSPCFNSDIINGLKHKSRVRQKIKKKDTPANSEEFRTIRTIRSSIRNQMRKVYNHART